MQPTFGTLRSIAFRQFLRFLLFALLFSISAFKVPRSFFFLTLLCNISNIFCNLFQVTSSFLFFVNLWIKVTWWTACLVQKKIGSTKLSKSSSTNMFWSFRFPTFRFPHFRFPQKNMAKGTKHTIFFTFKFFFAHISKKLVKFRRKV